MTLSNEQWKGQDKRYHEDPQVVASYHNKMWCRYLVERRHYSLDVWMNGFKERGFSKILDFGCGSGIASIELLKKGFQTVSLDASEEMLKELKARAEKENLKCECIPGDVENLPFGNSSFDAVVCMGVLHHLPDIKKGVENQIRVLKDKGQICIAEPFKKTPWFSFIYYVPVNIAKRTVRFLRRNKIETLDDPLTVEDLGIVLNTLKENGFQVKVTYLAYWPVICAVLPEAIGYLLVLFLNSINFDKSGDSVLITAQRTV